MSIPSLSTIAILNLLSPKQQEELYYVLRKKHIERRSENYISIEDKLEEIRDKYFDLVWYARSNDEDREEIPEVDRQMTRVENSYPEEIHDLFHTPDWSHGFNSGALAISRLISAYEEETEAEDSDNEDFNDSDQEFSENSDDSDEKFEKYFFSRKGQIEMAENEFPMLDT